MDRKELDRIITEAAQAMSCRKCLGELYSRIAHAAVECTAEHNATDLGNRVSDKKLSAVEAFDMLTGSLRPLYRLIGEEVSEGDLASIRAYVEARASAKLN